MAVQYQNITLESSFHTVNDANNQFIMFPELQQLVDKMAACVQTAEPLLEDEQITIDLIQPDDIEEVLNLLKRTFFKDEPLNEYLQLGDECQELEDYCTKSIHERCSFKAVNANNELLGVFINGIVNKPLISDGPPTSHAESCKHNKFVKIMGLMDYIDSKFDMFKLHPEVETFLDGKILAVDGKCRGQGIAGKLTDKTIEYMQNHNIKVFHVLCTSHFSARVLEKMNFEEVYRLPYADYKVEDEVVLAPNPPHVAARIFKKIVTK